jgi:hypothetical protein
MIMEINDLDDINPVTIGFLEHYIPRYKSLEIQNHRVQALLPPNAPKIQLQFGNLWGKGGDRIRVVLIKCDKSVVETLVQDFEELHAEKTLSFFLWQDFLYLTTEQQTTLVQQINHWRGSFRSILIPGFIDHNDNVPMWFNPIDDCEEKLSKIGVTEYMQNMVKNGNGENLFHYVYPPQRGIRETIVQLQNFPQALSYAKVCLGELARDMDAESSDRVFADPNQAFMDASKKKWVPNNRVLSIIPTYTNSNNNNDFNPKRPRQETEYVNPPIPLKISRSTHKTSYSLVTVGTTNTAHNTIHQDMEQYKQELNSKMDIMQQTINNNNGNTNIRVQNIENKMDEIQTNMIQDAERTKESINNMKTDIGAQMTIMKADMLDTKQEIISISTNMDKVTAMLSTLLEATIPQDLSTTTPKHKLLEEDIDSDINMMDKKQHGGLQVTRSSNKDQ